MTAVLIPEVRLPMAGGQCRPDERRLRIAVVGAAASVHVRRRTAALASLGHDVVLIAPDDGNRAAEQGTARSLLSGAGQRLQLVRRIARIDADVVYVHFAAGPAAWLAGALVRGPLAVCVMGGDVLSDERGGTSRIHRWLTTRLLRRADLITSKSDHITRSVVALGIDRRKIMKVTWGVDLNRFHPHRPAGLRSRYGFNEDDVLVFCPRAIRGLYNIHVLLDAVARLRHDLPRVRLILTAFEIDPAYRRALAEQISRLSLDPHVRFLEAAAPDAMPELYNLADAVVSIPSSDGLPQSLFESLACGVPAVIGNLDRYREVVQHGESAWFVEINPEAVADGLRAVLTESALRSRLISNGLEAVRRHADAARELERVGLALEQLANGSSRRRGRSPAMLVAIALSAIGNRLPRSLLARRARVRGIGSVFR